MKRREAEDILSMMAAATTARLSPQQEGFWLGQLENLDAEIATEAILDGIKGWQRFPSWAEFGRAFQGVVQRRTMEAEREEREQVELEVAREQVGRAGKGLGRLDPWVKRWMVARLLTDPPDMRVFPEQMGPLSADELRGMGVEMMPDDAHVVAAAKLTDTKAFELFKRSGMAGVLGSP